MNLSALLAMWTPSTLGEHLVWSIIWILAGILMLVVGFKVFDKLTPKVDFQAKMNENGLACAIIVAAFILAIAYIVVGVIA
jgi:uncharacterized membrane protein YjfL (UPF0719 family)